MKLSEKAKELNKAYVKLSYDKTISDDKKLISYYSAEILSRASCGLNRYVVSNDERYHMLFNYFKSEGFSITSKCEGASFVVEW